MFINLIDKEVGMANTSKRGLASADEQTRKEVARKGGKASHGGGRRKNDN
jgi:general stress protein YciG